MKTFEEKNRISLWLNPNEQITSAYGRVTFKEWCVKEAHRLSRRGDNVLVGSNKQGRVALFRTRVPKPA
ncbi:MAG TPA: hypothetical protein PKA76_02615 [Pirellulaceae bacterium]|nr:hypothetical protein [Pirellulaceae bacterium]